MAAERRHQRSKDDPILPFYEEFVNKSSTRSNNTLNNAVSRQRLHTRRRPYGKGSINWKSPDHPPGSVSSLSPTMEDSPSRQHQGRRSTTTTATKKGDEQLTPWNEDKQKNKVTEPTKRLTLYERSQIRLKEREKKVQRIREEMMRECTFRPNATKSKPKKFNTKTPNKATKAASKTLRSPGISTPAGGTEATTPTTTSSTRQYWQNLQQKKREEQQQQFASTLSKDGSKTVSTTKSLRFEELYQDGLRKARQRPATEQAEQELRRKRQEEKEMQECTFKPKLYWGHKLMRKRRIPAPSQRGDQASNKITATRGGHRSLSPRRKVAELLSSRRKAVEPLSPHRKVVEPLSSRQEVFPPLSSRRRLFEPAPRPIKPRPLLPPQTQEDPFLLLPQTQDPIPSIGVSPISPIAVEEESCASLSLLRRHHDRMQERNQGADSPIPPLPLEIITTGIRPMSPVDNRPWQTALYKREDSISPLKARDIGIEIEIDAEDEKSRHLPRVRDCGTTVAGDASEAAQTQATEYGSI